MWPARPFSTRQKFRKDSASPESGFAKPEGGLEIDPKFFVDFGELRGHQVRLEGGDASSDSYCYA